jgi:cytochrome c biogenesis protein ResB
MVSKTQQPRNPYIIYAIQRDGKPEKRQAAPLNNPQPIDGGTLFVMFPQVVPVAGLHVKYDPGLLFIWAGFGLLVLGFYLNYYTPYRQVWVHMVRDKEGFMLTCAGRGRNLAIVQDKLRCSLTEGSE